MLTRAPANFGCDSIGWPDDVERFHSLTFQIDGTSPDPVSAVSDTGVELPVAWAPGFEGSPTANEVLDPNGAVAAADGEVVQLPEAANPDLRGWPLCVTPTAVTVYLPES